jgi:hypothetical protein
MSLINDLRTALSAVVAGLVPAIHVFLAGSEDVDARDEPGHDELWGKYLFH